MPDDLSARISAMPEYQELLKRRRALIVPLSILTLTIYFAFILALAFFPESLSVRIGEGVTSIGILIGLGVIFMTFAITGFYVYRNNRDVEGLIHTLQSKFKG
jgi:uncharacterized membrane protein (DUF485 family)